MPFRKIILFILFLLLSTFNLFANTTEDFQGKVIDINSEQKIVFTDLTNASLSIGDAVRVKSQRGDVVFFEVVGTSDIASKLFFQKKNSSDSDVFSRIDVGDEVVRFDKKLLKSKPVRSTENNVRLSRLRNENLKIQSNTLSFDTNDMAKDVLLDDSEKYLSLSSQLQEVLQAKKMLEERNQILTDQLSIIKSDHDVLKDQNDELVQEVQRLNLMAETVVQEKIQYLQEAEMLRQRHSELQKKLDHMAELLDKSLSAYNDN